MAIMVTGGAGYIGSHTCVELLNAGFSVLVYDSLVNSKKEALRRVEKITGKSITFIQGDVRDANALASVFENHNINAVVHFAGLKAVGESSQIPLHYYENNVSGSLVLFDMMEKYGCFNLVFSSSATVYGDKAPVPYVETLPLAASNVYGRTKLMVEDILRDCCSKPASQWSVSLLRYFNPIGAHPSGLIGEDPQGIPNNLLPYVAQVAVGKLPHLNVYGADYPTKDGTGVRDYIHVVDLARGHVQALQKMPQKGCRAYNLGTGCGYSVFEVLAAFERASGKKIDYVVAPRREGDLPEYYANADLAWDELQWKAELGLDEMVNDTWRWQSANPNGFE